MGRATASNLKRGLETGAGSRIAELRSFIDRGIPVPLGLQAARGWSANHQVLAIGYDLGRYEGDLGANQRDFRIFLYDPNYPARTMRLAPDAGAQLWVERDESDALVRSPGWQTYFVATNYRALKPPHISNPAYPDDGKIYQLIPHAPHRGPRPLAARDAQRRPHGEPGGRHAPVLPQHQP